MKIALVFTFLIALFSTSFAASDDDGKTALLIIDVQDCFMEAAGTNSGEDGTLPVADTAAIIPLINSIRQDKDCLFDVVVRSQDYHPPSHISFGPTHGLEPFAHLAGKGELPLTCVNPSSGSTSDASCCPTYHISPYDCESMLCPNTSAVALADIMESPACSVCKNSPEECFETTQAMWTNHCLEDWDSIFPPGLVTEPTDIVVQKGGKKYVDSYSAFMDNTKKLKTPLDDILKENSVKTIYVVGIATDYCVYYSTIDALSLGYEVYLVLDATRGIAQATVDAAVADMRANNATIINTADVLATECPDESSNAATLGFLLWSVVGFWMAVSF